MDQAQIIVLEPDFAEIVGDFEREDVLIQGRGLDWQKPQIVDICV